MFTGQILNITYVDVSVNLVKIINLYIIPGRLTLKQKAKFLETSVLNSAA